MKTEQGYMKAQMTWLAMLCLSIGRHSMYEGLVEIVDPKWASLLYLLDSRGLAASFFIRLTQDGSLMMTTSFLNEWALLLIGLGLTLGRLYCLSPVGGVILLAIYTLSHPSFMGASYMMPFEGSYLWIDKNLMEFAALGSICVSPTSQTIGFGRVLGRVHPILHKLKFVWHPWQQKM